ncbi:MAG: hypothetical protein ACFB01_07880 [Cohaesibacteraceae bacterium]
MQRILEDKVALVTNGGRGIGTDAVVRGVQASGGIVRAIEADARAGSASAAAVTDVIAKEGSLNILVSNAGASISKPSHFSTTLRLVRFWSQQTLVRTPRPHPATSNLNDG